MKKSDLLLDKHAKTHKVSWSLKAFKMTFPKLYKSIIGALDEALNDKVIKLRKEDIYLDMSKLPPHRQDEILRMIGEDNLDYDFKYVTTSFYKLVYNLSVEKWCVLTTFTRKRVEITYQQFKELYPTW